MPKRLVEAVLWALAEMQHGAAAARRLTLSYRAGRGWQLVP